MKYKFYDHTIIAYFGFLITSVLAYFIGMMADMVLPFLLPEEIWPSTLYGLAQIFMLVLFLFIYWLRFRRAFNGMLRIDLSMKRELRSLILVVALPVISNLIVAYLAGFSRLLPAIICGMVPGLCEEVILRGPGVTNYMRKLTRDISISDESDEVKIQKFGKSMKLILWISSICFGLIHLCNTLAGANIYNSLIQAAYAVGLGVLFFAGNACTGSMFFSIICHSLIDITALLNISIAESGGVITGDFSPAIFIPFVMGMICLAAGLKMLSSKNYEKIYRIWERKVVVFKEIEDTEIVQAESE